jgi:uncharacterized protein involved in exopolysaccharide biosynthesis/Mrp family chromosome partitioning ATPase
MFFRRKSPANSTVMAPVPQSVARYSDRQSEPDMRGLGRALWQKKSRIIAFTLIAAAGAFVVVNAMTPRYRSETRILLEARENIFLRAEADRANERPSLDPEAVTSQIQLVLSRDLARDVIKSNKLTDKPEFDPLVGGMSVSRTLLGLVGLARDPANMSPEERTLVAYYDRLNAYAVEKSRVIAIGFYSANAETAAQIANSIAETYLGMQQANKQQQTRAASQWLAGEITKMRAKVAEAEANIQNYRAAANLYVGSNNTLLPNQQLTEINSQISAARGQKADLEARARQMRELLRTGTTIDSSDIANSQSMRRLSEQRVALRAQIAEQSSTLLDQHPRIKELRAQIGELDRQIRAEGERLARQLDSDAKVAGNRLESLAASLDQVKKLASQTNEQDVHLRELERESKAQRDLLASYLAKYREAVARDNINAAPPEARIISRASPAIKPDFPKKLPLILIAAAAAFALSCGFIITGELLMPEGDGRSYPVHSYAEMAAYPVAYPQPVAAITPHVPRPPRAAVRAQAPPSVMRAAAAASSPLALQSLEQIAGHLRQAGDGGRRVAVFGAARDVGTTYAAISLARALGGDSSVVLVDLAFAAPNLSVISTDPQAPGLAELLAGSASFADIITTDQYSAVHLVATGDLGEDGHSLLASPELAGIIEALSRSYDYVVIDAGAVTDVPVELFAPLAGQAVLVASGTAMPAMREMHGRMIGAGFDNIATMLGGAQAVAA